MTSSPTAQLKWLIAVMGVCSSCQRQEGAIAVDLWVAPEVKADCLKVSLYDGEEELRWVVLPRVEGKERWQVAINPAPELPGVIVIVASGWLGRCEDEASLTLNVRTGGVRATFPTSAVERVSLTLEPPSPDIDADRDGYRGAAAGGADCRDDDAAIHPGATERCELEVDSNCDGLVACADPQCAATAGCQSHPDRLAMNRLPPVVLAGGCVSPLWVELRDASGPRSATRSTPITVEGAELFSSEDCSGPALGPTLVPYLATTTAHFSARFPTPGLATLKASAEGLLAAVASVQVEPTPIAALRLTGTAAVQTAGVCSGPLVLQLLDAQQAPTTTALAQTVALEAQPGEATGAFFSDDTCAGPAGARVVVLPGQGTTTFRFRGTHAGLTTLTATAAGHMASATLTVVPSAAAQLAFLDPPLALRTSEACSSERKAALRLEVQDDFGNRTSTATAAVCSPAVSGGLSLSFFDAASGQCAAEVASVTIAAGQSQAGFLVRGNTVGSGAVTITAHNGLRATSQPLTVAAGDATRLFFTTGPQSPVAGECTPAETVLEAQDASGTPSSFAADTDISLATTHLQPDPGFHFFSLAGCPPAAVIATLPFPAGQSQVRLYFRGERKATFHIQATAAGGALAMLRGNSVRSGPPAWLSWSPPAEPLVAAGECSTSYALGLVDAFRNPTSFATAQPLQVLSVPSGLTFDTAVTQCQAASALSFPSGVSRVEVQARGVTAGAYALSATTPEVSTEAPAGLEVQPGPTGHLVFVGFPGGVAAGACSGAVTLRREDAFHNASSDGTLEVTLTSAGLSVAAGPDCAETKSPVVVTFNGTASSSSAFSVLGTVAGQASVTAVASVGTATATATALLDVTAGPPHHLAFSSTAPPAIDAGVCSGPVSLELRDEFDNLASSAGLAVALSASPDGGATFFGDVGCTSGPVEGIVLSGTAAQLSFVPVATGSLWVTASSPALDGGSASQGWYVVP